MKLRALLKWGFLIKENVFRNGGQGSFAVRRFYNGYENLMKSPKKGKQKNSEQKQLK
jgi:hypothetical protein